MSIKQMFVFLVSFLVLATMFAIGDVFLAGVLSVVVILFDFTSAFTVFKWVVLGLLLIELPILAVYLYNSIKNERNEF